MGGANGAASTLNRHGRAPVSFHHIGRWWNRRMEIDLVAWNQETGHALFVECKWTSRPVDIEILHTLIQRSEAVPVPARHRSYLLVSRQGFTARLRRARQSHTHLWDLDDITSLVKGPAPS